jgi:hypothetical protein
LKILKYEVVKSFCVAQMERERGGGVREGERERERERIKLNRTFY